MPPAVNDDGGHTYIGDGSEDVIHKLCVRWFEVTGKGLEMISLDSGCGRSASMDDPVRRLTSSVEGSQGQ